MTAKIKWSNININWHLMQIDYLETFYINELHTAKNAKKKNIIST